ncbi:MAG: sulfatase [Acidobacteria bacterium]|nr:sulfatase [Acidobacteriota bacterium]
MTRRQLMLGGAAAPLLQSQQLRPAQPRRQPNIVLLLSDDHSAPYLGCYGDPAVRTPHLDRFASQGMRFDRAFTAAPQCVPSRTALMTGRSPISARMGRFSSPLPPDIVTMPERLREAGYFTGICGRLYHLDGPGVERWNPVTREIIDRHGMMTFSKRVDYLDATGQPRLNDRINTFFDQKPADKPFFLWANFSDPHHVWDAQGPGGAVDPAKVRLPAQLPDLPGVRGDLARYLAEIEHLDADFNRVLQTIEKRAPDDNTIVVFMGDNGMAFPHGKGSLYDPGTNVPLMMRWPGMIQPGSSNRALFSGEDLAPTLLDAAGLTSVKGMTGRSYLPLLRGLPQPSRRYVFGARLAHGNAAYTAETMSSEWDQSRMVRSERYKLIYNCTPWMEYQPVDSMRDPGWQQMVAAHADKLLKPEHDRAYFTRPRPIVELYDLETDPAELTNLAGKPEMAAIERELKIALQEKMIVDYDFLPLPLGATNDR